VQAVQVLSLHGLHEPFTFRTVKVQHGPLVQTAVHGTVKSQSIRKARLGSAESQSAKRPHFGIFDSPTCDPGPPHCRIHDSLRVALTTTASHKVDPESFAAVLRRALSHRHGQVQASPRADCRVRSPRLRSYRKKRVTKLHESTGVKPQHARSMIEVASTATTAASQIARSASILATSAATLAVASAELASSSRCKGNDIQRPQAHSPPTLASAQLVPSSPSVLQTLPASTQFTPTFTMFTPTLVTPSTQLSPDAWTLLVERRSIGADDRGAVAGP